MAVEARSNVIKPINYLLNRWQGFVRFINDGRTCMTGSQGGCTECRH